MSREYILNERGEPELCGDPKKWSSWFSTADRRVGLDVVGDVTVSTVFLGLDHNFYGSGKPVLWETMVFGGPLDQAQERYTTREEAIEGHRQWVNEVSRAASEHQM